MLRRLFGGSPSKSDMSEKDREFQLLKIHDVTIMMKKGNYDGARRALLNERAKARVKDAEDFLPLHLAVAVKAPDHLVLLLIDSYEPALTERDPQGRLPIHIVCADPSTLMSYLQLILSHSPSSVLMEKDANGDLPLHQTIRYRCPTEASLALLQAPGGGLPTVNTGDKDGNLALHLALRHGSEDRLIYAILKANPDAIRVFNHRKDLPIHRAALFNANLDILKALCFDGCLAEPDSQGNLPIHLFFMQLRGGRPSDAVMNFFLELNPSSIGRLNHAKCTPLQILSQYHDQLEKYKY
jgi:ankyrin repeat protein